MVPPDSGRVPRVPPYLGNRQRTSEFRLRDHHPLRCGFPAASTTPKFCNLPGSCTLPGLLPQPRPGNACRLHTGRFGLFPVRSPLLGESRLISSPTGTEMFQFPAFASLDDGCLDRRVAPFGNQRINARVQLPVAYRSLPRPSSPLGAKASTMRPS